MSQIDKDRFFSMARAYDKMVGYLLPRYDFLQDEMIRLIFAHGKANKLVVDLGAGSGILLDKILTRYPQAQCCWMDYSDDFHKVALQRLARHGQRVQFVLSPLEDDWESQLSEPPEVICSMSAIHHLETDDKKSLYARCHKLLKPGGWLFNLDEMSTVSKDAYMNTLKHWVKHVEKVRSEIPKDLLDFYLAWQEKFKLWKIRNIDNAAKPKSKGDDIHEGYIEQMQWLRQTGFVDVDLFVKFQLWSLIGGRKIV